MKRIINKLLTLIFNPLVSFMLFIRGNTDFIIGKRCKINTTKGITLNKNFRIGSDSRFLIIYEYYKKTHNPKLTFGKNVSIGNRCSFLVADELFIGDNCLIASDVLFTTESHGIDPLSYESYNKQPLVSKPIVIGEGCWIGEKVSIMPGVVIGEKSIIATNSVVTKSFPPYSMIAGIPAKIIKSYDINEKKWVEIKK